MYFQCSKCGRNNPLYATEGCTRCIKRIATRKWLYCTIHHYLKTADHAEFYPDCEGTVAFIHSEAQALAKADGW